MHYVPRYTVLAHRISDGARIAIPLRRFKRGGTNNTATFTAQANNRARAANKARGA
jgi:hypothetical protein